MDHFLVVFGVLQLDVLVQAALGAVTLWTVLNWALVMPRDFGCSSPVPLLLFIVDLKWHIQHYLVVPLVRLHLIKNNG